MVKPNENMNDQDQTALSKSDFIRFAGIGSELAEFVADFIECPEIFFSMSVERRCKIENQMDSILSSFGQG